MLISNNWLFLIKQEFHTKKSAIFSGVGEWPIVLRHNQTRPVINTILPQRPNCLVGHTHSGRLTRIEWYLSIYT